MSTIEPVDSAKAAGLRYVSDDRPGFRRVKRRDGFHVRGPLRQAACPDAEVARIRKLAIPPADTDVWISPDPRGHL